MFCRWILDQHRILQKHYQILASLKYSTQAEAIECVLRCELRVPTENVNKFVKKHNFLLEIKPEELKKTFQRLRRLNYEIRDIRTHPKILLQNEYQLLNNFQRLREVGFAEITVYRLANITQIMCKSVHFNQSFNFLPKNINILQHIYETAKIPLENGCYVTDYDPQMELGTVHRMALRHYMTNQLKFTIFEIDKLWINRPEMKRRSLQSIVQTVELLEKIFNVPVRELPKYILILQPEEISELMHLDNVSGIDIKTLLSTVQRCNLVRLKEIQNACYSYRISDSALKFSPRLFQMNVNVLKERADKIYALKRGSEFLQHIAIGRLISGMGRLQNYLDSKKIPFDSVFNDSFVDFFLNGFMMKLCNPALIYLCNKFNKTQDEIRKAFKMHPHCMDSQFHIVRMNIEYLLSHDFTHDDIFNDLPIILYSIDEIKEYFDRLKKPEYVKELNINPEKLTKSQHLRLCMYVIEKKCNFNSEGIFLNSHAIEFKDDESSAMEEICKQAKL